LRTHGATLTVTNRTRARADEMAQRFGADVVDWNDLQTALTAADIVIASTGAQRPVLTLEMIKQVRKARRGRQLCLIDIGVPRDVDPEVGRLSDIYLFDIDALQAQASAHRAEREEEAAEAEAVVEQELGRFVKRWRSRQLGPMVSALQAHFNAIARTEVQRLSGGVDEKERKARLDLIEGIIKKLLHLPMTALRGDDAEEAVSLVQAVQRLFSLSPVAAVPEAEEAPAEGVTGADKKATGT
jgi:glutamyl-tRNA reductase